MHHIESKLREEESTLLTNTVSSSRSPGAGELIFLPQVAHTGSF